MIGFLSPDGIFYECDTWCHSMTASFILQELNIKRNYDHKNLIVSDEDILLDIGYICLRARDAFRNEWNRNKQRMFLTNNQINWLIDNLDREEVETKKKDISDMLINDEEWKSLRR